jgi:hypothetical protein
MARCHRCGEPSVPVLIGSVAEVETNPLIRVWCQACAIAAEAEQITKEAVDGTA